MKNHLYTNDADVQLSSSKPSKQVTRPVIEKMGPTIGLSGIKHFLITIYQSKTQNRLDGELSLEIYLMSHQVK